MPKPTSATYFAAQHSAMAFNQDETFAQGLEPVAVTDARTVGRLLQVGAVPFRSLAACEAYCEAEMYPADYDGLVPRAPGEFLAFAVEGQRIYRAKAG